MAVTAESIDAAMRELLPRMESTSLTLNLVMNTLATKFAVDVKELKAQWKPVIKDKVLELIVLCPDYEVQPEEGKENADSQKDEEEEEEEEWELPKPRRSHAVAKKRRNAISDESDAQDDNGSGVEQSESGGDAESEDENEAPKKRQRISKMKERASSKASTRKKSPPAKKPRASAPKQSDPPGLAALKKLGQAAGVLNPKVYRDLKAAESVEEAEEVVRGRLQETGVRFSGQYPSARDISAAKKKRARDKELEDIDPSLIITSERPRRSAAQHISYVPESIPDADGALVGGGNGATADEEEEEAEVEDDADDDDDADADADASGSESDESEAEF